MATIAHVKAGYRPIELQAKCTASQHALSRQLPFIPGQLAVAPYTRCMTSMHLAQQLCMMAHMPCAQALVCCEGTSSF